MSIRAILEDADKPLGNTKQQMDELEKALTAYVEEIIGEDEKIEWPPGSHWSEGVFYKDIPRNFRNELRAEQRLRLKGTATKEEL